MEKLIRYARNIDKILTVLRGIVIAFSATAILALLIGIAFAEKILVEANARFGDLSVNTGSMSLKMWVEEPVMSAGNLRSLFASIVGLLAVIAVLSLYAIRVFKGIMGEMKEGRPFSQSMPGRIRKTAYVIFAYAAVTPLLPLLPLHFTFRLLDIQGILAASPLIESVKIDYQYSLNILAVCVGFMVLLLSLVFEYGAKLQRESDETL